MRPIRPRPSTAVLLACAVFVVLPTAARAQVAGPAATATSLAVLYATEEPKPAQPNDPTADVNGCGPGWGAKLVPEKPGGYDFHEACNEHDRCYQTLGKTKKQCDDEFEAAMKKVCDSTEKKITLWTWKWDKKMGKFVKTKLKEIDYSDAAKAECKAWAEVYSTAVRGKLGDQSYKSGQEEAQKKKDAEKKPEEKQPEQDVIMVATLTFADAAGGW